MLGAAVIAAFLGWALVGLAGDAIDRETWLERGSDALAPFKGKLMSALAKSLQDGGPEAAIDVCRIAAPEIAAEVSEPGVEIGRTSHKLRNKSNTPRKWMRPLLEVYVSASGKTEPEVVPLDGGGIGYVEPIHVKKMCLACHGSAITTEVQSRLAEHYPEDRARDFKEGDFRGLFWVEFREMPRKQGEMDKRE
jgi:hypothetical protein